MIFGKRVAIQEAVNYEASLWQTAITVKMNEVLDRLEDDQNNQAQNVIKEWLNVLDNRTIIET